MLRGLRWAAAEAQESGDTYEEEEITETLTSVLSCPQFADHLREKVLPQKLSMLGLGNVARLCGYARLSADVYQKILSCAELRVGIQRLRNSWVTRHRLFEYWFTWREYFAWRHLQNLDSALGSTFLEEFGYERLFSYGQTTRNGLSNLLFMGARTPWLKGKA